MYNKIAPIILNSGKAPGLSDVFVSQPDALKENLAGKIFVLAEIGGKKNEARKVWNFLISALNDNYYNDEKILLRDKIEGLKIENIFEAALTKTNKALGEFLLVEKLRLNPATTNITLGVIYENKLHFSSFGKNRALLLYRRGEQCEIINVEASAADLQEQVSSEEAASVRLPILFSSVISGEIPLGSYFIFASEALPEYLSGKEMVAIITKLPPIVAAEQIKNVLSKINTFIPFLGVIIKNTAGLAGAEMREDNEENLSAHSSISSLNYTEQKTEQMLAPAGLINLSKTLKSLGGAFKKIQAKRPERSRKNYLPEEEKVSAPALDLGKIKTLNLARPDSFLTKERIFFKKKSSWFWPGFKNILRTIPGLFSRRFWDNLWSSFRLWLKALNSKNRFLFIVLSVLLLVFALSLSFTLVNKRRAEALSNFNNQVSQIEEKQNLVDSHLLYNDEEGARLVFGDVQALLASLPQKTAIQKNTYERLSIKLREQENRLQKMFKIDQAEKANELSGLGIKSVVFAGGRLYAAADKFIYSLTPNSASSSRVEISGASNLSRPQFDRKNLIYYWDQGQIAQFNLSTGANSLIKFSDINLTGAAFQVFNSNLYVLSPADKQIYRYGRDKSGFSLKSNWLKEEADLSQASDLGIDGSVYVLNSNGSVQKFYKNKRADYQAAVIYPAMTQASKLIVGTNYLYVFEPGSKRLAVLALKDGHLVNQYQVNSLLAPQDVAVDEVGRKAYFLDNEAIYQINLNQ